MAALLPPSNAGWLVRIAPSPISSRNAGYRRARPPLRCSVTKCSGKASVRAVSTDEATPHQAADTLEPVGPTANPTGAHSRNVQYRPFTAQGPITEGKSVLRAVTLFELDDLVKLAGRDDKRVIMIARQCGKCGRTRASALKPLLTENSGLRVFSDLVLDTETCKELLGQSAHNP
jgi:hypothetical protein